MSLGKMAMSAAAGFALGAGMMLSSNAPKWKRAIIREANMIKKAVEKW